MLLSSKHPFLSLSQEIIEICKPLETFHIHHFTYQEHFNDGSKVSLSNKPRWIEDYYNLNLFQSSLFEDKPSTYQSRYDVWYGDYDLDVYRHGKLYYNTTHGISIVEAQSESCEFYLFSTAAEHHQAIGYLAKNIDILYHFVAYFRERANKLLKKARENKIIQPFAFRENMIISIDDEIKKRDFFAQTSIKKYILKIGSHSGYLTQREFDCLNLLVKRKTAKEIAKALNLSSRTVEYYLERIKLKLNCDSRSQLIDLFLLNKLERQFF